MEAGALLDRIIDAHGGRALAERLRAVEAEISASGALFALKRRPPLVHARVTAMAREPRFLFHDYLGTGRTGELAGPAEVRIFDTEGRVLERRADPRARLGGPGTFFRWDALDFLYFCGYATWNYLISPFLFLFPGVAVEEIAPRRGMPPGWAGLRVQFPPSIPTHSATQLFFFDGESRLRRLEYVAEVVGRWAHAAHLCEGYRDFDGYWAPTRRRVYPIALGGRTLPAPTLVAIDVHSLRPVFER